MQQLQIKLKSILKDLAVPAYLVGGTVRDQLLGREASDLDVVVERDTFNIAMRVAAELGGRCIPLDKTHGTVRVVCNAQGSSVHIDFSPFKGADIYQDLAHRDFTVNAMAMPVGEQSLLDPFDGRRHLSAKSIAMVSPSAFRDDPLRILRGFRLAGELGFHIEAETLHAMAANVSRLEQVSGERIFEELTKLMLVRNSYSYINQADKELNLWVYIFPLVDEMRATEQNFYHRDNVWEHSLKTLRCLEELLQRHDWPSPTAAQLQDVLNRHLAGNRPLLVILKIAALMHDIGKPASVGRRLDGRITFYGHEKIGPELIQPFVKRMKLANKEAFALKLLIGQHMRPLWLYNEQPITNSAKYKLYQDLGEYYWPCLILSLADVTATYLSSNRRQEIKAYQKFIFSLLNLAVDERQKKILNPDPLVDGNDLKDYLGLPPSKIIGQLLRAIAEAQVEGVVTNKEQALQFAKELYEKNKPFKFN